MVNANGGTDFAKLLNETMDGMAFNTNGIAKLLSTIKTEKASGLDEVPNYVLRASAGVIALYFSIIFTKFNEVQCYQDSIL